MSEQHPQPPKVFESDKMFRGRKERRKMSEHPKFTCRREGHAPRVTVINIAAENTSGHPITYVTRCTRCGKWLEVTVEPEETQVDASAPD